MLSKLFKELSNKPANSNTIASITYNSKTYTNDSDIANIFNKHFTNVADKYLSRPRKDSTHLPNMQFLKEFIKGKLPVGNIYKIPLITEHFVMKFISQLDSNKATGKDNISAKILKLSSPIIIKQICDICNHSIRHNTFPADWKIARISPLHKRNSTQNPENYRPISILPLMSKILEKHVYNSLYEFLSVNDLFSSKQYGFRSNHSCETALIAMTDNWLNSIYKNEYCGVLFIDLCKAFDLVNKNILLEKLKLYNLDDNSLLWFQSYLTDRKQAVKINSNSSDELTTEFGVPQGSILGPLLFLIYINDLPLENSTGNTALFADDATISVCSKNIDIVKQNLDLEAERTYNWCEDNGMVISIEKTKAMLITSRHKSYRLTEAQRDLNINLHGNKIISTKQEKLLGILIDNNLAWHPQVKKVRQTIIFKISILRKIRKYLPTPIRILYYNYYIKPHLEYCCSVWGNCSKSDIDTLIKLQKQAARLILETDRYAPSAPLFSQLRWQTFDQITRERQAFMVFKATNNKTPSYITNMFQSACINTQHSLRSKTNNKLHIPKAHSKSLRYTGPKIWNSLSNKIRKAKTSNQFRTEYKSFLNHGNQWLLCVL